MYDDGASELLVGPPSVGTKGTSTAGAQLGLVLEAQGGMAP